ncbi:major facilitator superfamily domain-containing protein [Umbelopsis sp. AD052]|nr:major facilitator superfamily domain-containing protein [Umbelopsis sp. AD052]
MVFCTVVACIGSFSQGWTIGSPNIPGDATHNCANGYAHVNSSFLPDCLPMNSLLWGFSVSSFCIGGLLASLFGNYPLTKMGRKKTLVVNNIGWVIGAILIAFSTGPAMFTIGRIFCGISCGLGALATTTYVGEISTIQGRGAMGSMNQLMVVIGILLSNLIGLPLATVPLWRLNYALVAVPAIVQALLMSMCVESPRYLVSQNRLQEAKLVLQKLRPNADVSLEFQEIVAGQRGDQYSEVPTDSKTGNNELAPLQQGTEKSISQEFSGAEESAEIGVSPHEKSVEAMSIIQLFKHRVVRVITFTVLFLHCTQQLSAINGVMYYSTTIFLSAYDAETSMYMAIGTSALNLVCTIVQVVLIDRVGRRFLLILSQAGACLFCITLVIGGYFVINELLVASVFLFVASFAVGLGPIPWMITSELSPTYAASSMGAIATCANWSMNFVIGLVFPTLMDSLNSFSFIIFGCILFCSTIITILFVPETKGKPIEQVYAEYDKKYGGKQ